MFLWLLSSATVFPCYWYFPVDYIYLWTRKFDLHCRRNKFDILPLGNQFDLPLYVAIVGESSTSGRVVRHVPSFEDSSEVSNEDDGEQKKKKKKKKKKKRKTKVPKDSKLHNTSKKKRLSLWSLNLSGIRELKEGRHGILFRLIEFID